MKELISDEFIEDLVDTFKINFKVAMVKVYLKIGILNPQTQTKPEMNKIIKELDND